MAHRFSHVIGKAAAAVSVSGVILFGAASPAGAASGCGEYSFGFDGTRLLNDGISTTAGPFSINLPEGTYTVTAKSFDDHDAHPGQLEQTQEQWRIHLDSGYVSPPTNDVPESSNYSTTTFTNQTIGASSTITLTHLGQGGVNSVSPLCVGFTSEAPAPTSVTPTTVTSAADTSENSSDAASDVDSSSSSTAQEPAGQDPVAETPVSNTSAANTANVSPIFDLSTVPGPIAGQDPAIVNMPEFVPLTDNSAASTLPVIAEVKSKVELNSAAAQQAPVLALTGPSQTTLALLGAAFALLLVGFGLVTEAQRRTDTN